MSVLLPVFLMFWFSISTAMDAQAESNAPVGRVPSLLALAKKAAIQVINSQDFLRDYAQDPTVLPTFGPKLETEIINGAKADQNGLIGKTLRPLTYQILKHNSACPDSWIAGVYWHNDSQKITTRNFINHLVEWNLQTGKRRGLDDYQERIEMALLTEPYQEPVTKYVPFYPASKCNKKHSYSPDGRWKTHAASGGSVELTNVKTNKTYSLPVQSNKHINNFACWSPDGTKIASSLGANVIVWDWAMIEKIRESNLKELLELCADTYARTAIDHQQIEKKSCILS